MIIVLASTSSLSGFFAALNVLLGCTGLFVLAFWGCLAVWTWRDIRARTSDRRLQIGATVLVASLFVGGWFVYRLLRPRQTLAQISERQLEEESLLAEMAERETCTTCHTPVAADFQVCPACGQKLKHPCPTCMRLLNLRWTFCPYCATTLLTSPMPGAPPGRQGMPPGTLLHPMGGHRF